MLLNDFLYQRSVMKNVNLKSIIEFKPLIPKSTIYNYTENPYEKEEHIEEIKEVIVGGSTKSTLQEQQSEDVDELIDDLISTTESVVDENLDLSEKNRELFEENKKLQEDCDEQEKEEIEEKEKKEKNFRKNTMKALVKISKQIEDQDGGDYNDIDENNDVDEDKKKVELDNISKEGGKLKDENVKNVVVSFF